MAKQQNEALFEESSRGAVGAVTAFVFILSVVLAFGGMVVMSFGFQPELGTGVEASIFIGGLIACILGFVIPFTWLAATGK